MKLIAVPLALALATAAPAIADPNPQLTLSVANRLAPYGIRVDPAALTTAQASALHLMLVTKNRKSWIDIRRRAENILTNEEFRD